MQAHMSSLIEKAARGDRDAAGEYLASQLPYLTRVARSLTNGVIDADDLLAEAITQLLHRWAEGVGPVDNVNAYIIRSMRNRLIDEYRAPRSQNVPLNIDLSAPEDVTLAAEHFREARWLGRALANLPDDQRTVLTETVLFDSKPRELSGTLGRPATAVSSLKRRATLNLRRHFLREILEEDAPDDCVQAAGALSPEVHDDLDQTSDSGLGMRHIRQCSRCRRAWGVFAQVGGSLSVLALLVTWSPALIRGGMSPEVPTHEALPSDGVSPDEVSPDEMSAGELSAGESQSQARSPMLLATGLAITGIGLIGLVAFLLGGGASRHHPPAVATMSVSAQDVAGVLRLEMGFGLEDTTAESETILLTLDQDATLIEVPDRWNCDWLQQTLRCEATQPAATSAEVFRFQRDNAGNGSSPERPHGFALLLEAVNGEHAYEADFSGHFPPAPQLLEATVQSQERE